ncbi:MAG: aminotransferase class V-fold PLP-dependent enzyme, partial [Planctomycetota bacterium]
ATEHRAVLAACRAAAAHTGATLHSIPVRPDGELEHEALERLLARLPGPALVALHSANNETGVEYRVFEIADRAHAAGGHLVVDAIQSLGKRPVDLGVWGADLATFSGHKIGAPPGVGAVFVRDDALFTPLLEGGGQERGRRAGTENVPGIVGFGVAAGHLPERLAAIEATARLRDRLEDTLTRALDGVTVHGRSRPRLPNTSFVSFAGVRGDALRIALDLAGVCVSGGSACASGAIEPSHVLRAMGVDEPRARSAVRFSLGPDTTPAEIERAAEHTIRLVRRQRRRGPCTDAPTPP